MNFILDPVSHPLKNWHSPSHLGASLVIQLVKNLPAMQATQVKVLGQEDPLWFTSWVRKIPWRREWQPTAVFLPGEQLTHNIYFKETSVCDKYCDLPQWGRINLCVEKFPIKILVWWKMKIFCYNRFTISPLNCFFLYTVSFLNWKILFPPRPINLRKPNKTWNVWNQITTTKWILWFHIRWYQFSLDH